MLNFITKLLHPKQVQIIKRDPLRITMAEWRASPDMVRLAQIALRDRTVRQMLDVLWNNQIAKWTMSPSLSAEERSVRSAWAEGYCMSLNDFERLAEYKKPDSPLEATFAPDNSDLLDNP